MKKCPYCGKEFPDDVMVCVFDQTALSAGTTGNDSPIDSRPPTKPSVTCPACGALDNYKSAIALKGSFSLIVFLIGGLLAIFFHNAGRPRRVQCNQCGALFNVFTPAARVSRVIFWLLVTYAFACLILLLIFFWYIAHEH